MKTRRKKHYKIVYYNIFTNETIASYDCDALSHSMKIKAARLFCPENCYGKIKSEIR